MIKPGLPYLDVISKIKEKFLGPLAVYQVSGEYSMIKFASKAGAINEKEIVLETMKCFKRAGINMIITYFTPQLLEWLN